MVDFSSLASTELAMVAVVARLGDTLYLVVLSKEPEFRSGVSKISSQAGLAALRAKFADTCPLPLPLP